jgi:hypothetical protein
MKILTKPVFNMLGELLDGKNVEVSQTEKGMEIFRDNLSMIASLLQAADKVFLINSRILLAHLVATLNSLRVKLSGIMHLSMLSAQGGRPGYRWGLDFSKKILS